MPFPRGSRTLTKTFVLAFAAALVSACAVGEQPRPGAADPQAPPPVATPQDDAPAAPPVVRADTSRHAAPARVAVLLPRSGPSYLQQYADLLLEGIRIAAGPDEIELIVLDDGGLAERDSALVAEALDRGAVAVIGPLLSSGIAAAARGRNLTPLVLLSPTAAEVPGIAADVYTLNGTDVRGPRALAEFAIAGGLRSAAVIYPSEEALARQAWAFARAYQELGGRVATMVPYDSGTTTFGTHIGRVVDAHVDVVYLPLSPQDVQVIAPQLAYYGLSDRGSSVVVMGNDAWLDEEVLRLVGTQFTDGVVAATASPHVAGETGWDDFVRTYEETHRRSLDNPFPALGYDAMRLVRAALDGGVDTPASVAERFRATRAFRGATGVLSVEDGMITRAPFIYRVTDGVPAAPPPPDQLRVPVPAEPASSTLEESPR